MKNKLLFSAFIATTITCTSAAYAMEYTHMILRSSGRTTDMNHRPDQKTTGFTTMGDKNAKNNARMHIPDTENFTNASVTFAGAMRMNMSDVTWKGKLTLVIPYQTEDHYLVRPGLTQYTTTDRNDVLYATAESDEIDTKGGHDRVHTGAGDDHVRLGADSNTADGGTGFDTAYYIYARDYYTVRREKHMIYVQSKDAGRSSNDTLVNFEAIAFGDGTTLRTDAL